MATNQFIDALINDGADAMSNMYDVFIKFPGAEGETAMTVRATGFDVPEASTKTYPVEYKGNKYDKVAAEINFERKFTLEFRMDAAYNLHDTMLDWHRWTANPADGTVANQNVLEGTVIVRALATPFWAADKSAAGSELTYMTDTGDGTLKAGDNVREWEFQNVWPEKVGQPKYKREGSDALTFSVDFRFGQMPKFPGYSKNAE